MDDEASPHWIGVQVSWEGKALGISGKWVRRALVRKARYPSWSDFWDGYLMGDPASSSSYHLTIYWFIVITHQSLKSITP